MRTIALLLAMSSAVCAADIDWSHGACYENGIYFPARPFSQCVSADKGAYAQTMPPPNLPGITSGTLATTNSISITAYSPKCPADRSVVMVGSGQYKCAKDLTDPE